jgi:periplasmic divalent cation tolerance protein
VSSARGDVLQLLATCPPDCADRIARVLVEERLAACVQRIDGVHSVYRWQGEVESASESLLLIKTSDERYSALEARFVEIHPYEVPELLRMPVTGLASYLAFVFAATQTASN